MCWCSEVRYTVSRTTELDASYRVVRTVSMFNTPLEPPHFELDADVPTEDRTWRIGVVVGPSGSGKSQLARLLAADGFGDVGTRRWTDAPLVDAIAPHDEGAYASVVAALAAVGLGSVPTWLRPYAVLSTGERFRADLARVLAEPMPRQLVDEYSSVVDRRVATIGSQAFAKAWRRLPDFDAGPPQVVLCTPHEDVLPWLQPDWVLRTALGQDPGLFVGPGEVAAAMSYATPNRGPEVGRLTR